ncbi:ABC transporter substrate-binding protein [Mesorhizobium microcysteis]|uniref:ABC transporter substrate-binding protein n=1 Tax=Neoaquamicrobium microcysteis TaxID=2682781 RepID=A0A5D4H0H0_9HYPH|nr:ABC transporter substrate-binding protein [Mesorhizobium microcysteis]TYR33539.1 ABC transporter substrate-binding protein [Mesorhizobium microcysteis]
MRAFIGLVGAVSIGLSTSVALAADPGVSDTEIVVGGIAPFTGPGGPLGYAGTLGNRIAAAEINENGGVNGRTIRLVIEDDDYVPAKTVQAMQKLIDVDQIFSLTTVSGGSHGLAIMPMIEEGDIPTINPLVTTEAHYEPPRPSFFGIGTDYQQGVINLVKYLDARTPDLSWGAIVQDDESGQARLEGLDTVLEELGKTSSLQQKFRRGQTDFAAEVLNARASGATALILGGLPAQHAAILKEAKKIGYEPQFGVMWVDHIPQVIDLFGPEGDGVYVYDFVPSMTDQQLAPFLELARKHLPADDIARLNRYSVIAYAALKVQAAAMEACGQELTRRCVNENIEKTTDFETGLMAPISFGEGVRLTDMAGRVLRIDAAAGRFVPAE